MADDRNRNTIEGPIFLVGCPRSGTTLLQEMLDAHPKIAIAPETFFVRRFWARKNQWGPLLDDAKFSTLLDAITTSPEFAEAGLDATAYRTAAGNRPRRLESLFRLLLEQFAALRGVTLVGEKTPNHLLYMDRLQSWFPTAKFVHVLRDPRAVVASWRNVPWSTGSIAGDAEVWRKYARAALRPRLLNKAAFHTVRYEALVADPERVLRELCTFLKVGFEPAMLRYHERADSTVNAVREPWKAQAREPVSKEPVDKWRTELSPRDVRVIEAATWSELAQSGYVPENSLRPLLPALLQARARRTFKRTAKMLGFKVRATESGPSPP